MKYHKCAVPDCEKQTLVHMLMCYPHWAKVPHQVRKEVWKTYRAWKKMPDVVSVEHQYWDAVRVAIESVQKKKEQAQQL